MIGYAESSSLMHFPLCCASADRRQCLLSICQSSANAVSDTMGVKFFPFKQKIFPTNCDAHLAESNFQTRFKKWS
ncbi:MAG: DUF6783 domain-containing protein [Lacrimispora saccharolytica]